MFNMDLTSDIFQGVFTNNTQADLLSSQCELPPPPRYNSHLSFMFVEGNVEQCHGQPECCPTYFDVILKIRK